MTKETRHNRAKRVPHSDDEGDQEDDEESDEESEEDM